MHVRQTGKALSRAIVAALAVALLVPLSQTSQAGALAHNVVFCIGDGMGREHVVAGRAYAGAPLSFEAFTNCATARTRSANQSITDSAAAGSALATGHKVNNGTTSVAQPGDGRPYETLLEYFGSRGKKTGLVTSAFMTDATPAAFGSHTPSRTNLAAIAAGYFRGSHPNVLFGGGGKGVTPEAARQAGYVVVTNAADLLALNPAAAPYASGQFGRGNTPYEFDGEGGLPHLSEMTEVALRLLDGSTNGFFVMVEGGQIDHAAHINDIAREAREIAEFSRTLSVITNWATRRGDTLVVVTADHETGGLHVLKDRGAGLAPEVTWTTLGHTAADVSVYAWGPGSERFTGVMDNTDVPRLIKAAAGAR